MCDWDDRTAREELVGDLAADAHACLTVVEGRVLTGDVAEAAELLATVVGQDLEPDSDGRFEIARHVTRTQPAFRRLLVSVNPLSLEV